MTECCSKENDQKRGLFGDCSIKETDNVNRCTNKNNIGAAFSHLPKKSKEFEGMKYLGLKEGLH